MEIFALFDSEGNIKEEQLPKEKKGKKNIKWPTQTMSKDAIAWLETKQNCD